MALMTGEQYIESIKTIKMEIYMFGERYNNPDVYKRQLQNHQPFPIILVHLQKTVRCKNAASCKSATNFVCKNATKRYNDNRKPHNSIQTEELI